MWEEICFTDARELGGQDRQIMPDRTTQKSPEAVRRFDQASPMVVLDCIVRSTSYQDRSRQASRDGQAPDP